MANKMPPLTIGVEEELFLVKADSTESEVNFSQELLAALQAKWKQQIVPEFLGSQIELITSPQKTVRAVKEELITLRRDLLKQSNEFQLAPLASSTHPSASWRDQIPHGGERYKRLKYHLQFPAKRLFVNGMHIHIGINDDETRMALQNQLLPFLPLFLAMSSSSPFWEGNETGLHSYRINVLEGLPRTGLPQYFETLKEYEFYVQKLVEGNVIENAAELWWDVRLNPRFPTVEMRVSDVCTDINDAMSLVAFYQCLVRWLLREKRDVNQFVSGFPGLMRENRWRAQRYSLSTLSLFNHEKLIPATDIIHHLLNEFQEDAIELDCQKELAHIEKILARGTSADQQIKVYEAAMKHKDDSKAALREVTKHLIDVTARV